MAEKSAITFDQIWNNLVVIDQNENRFQFSACRNRHIVVLGSQKTKNYVVGDVIRGDTYNSNSNHQRKEERKTITYVMVQDDPSCNVCIVNLIDMPPLEHFIKHSEKHSNDPLSSPMAEVDKTIYKYATYIDLIILVCEENNFELMKNMKKWTVNQGHIMALVFIVDPNWNIEQREKFLLSIQNNQEFKENNLIDLFDNGIYCISDLSYNHFRSRKEKEMAQIYVKEWRPKFLAACVGGQKNKKYAVQLRDEKQSRKKLSCTLA